MLQFLGVGIWRGLFLKFYSIIQTNKITFNCCISMEIFRKESGGGDGL